MDDLWDLMEPAESFEALFPYPASLAEFTRTYEQIDVGYDCFLANALVKGSFYLVEDDERFHRDTWGWSAHAAYYDYDDGTRFYRTVDGHYKCATPEEAYATLCARLDDLRNSH